MNKVVRHDPQVHATIIRMLGENKSAKEIMEVENISKTLISKLKKAHYPEKVQIQVTKVVKRSTEFFEWW